MQALKKLIGHEHELDSFSRGLRDFAQRQRAAGIGAVHVTCSDEAAREESESFQHWFAEQLLPELKFGTRSPLRSVNLGSRYEWGAVRIAELHFATPETSEAFKLILVKVNSHVAAVESAGETVFGSMPRYGSPSTYCGALHALLDGQNYPAMHDLHEAFSCEGVPRLQMLRDPEQTDPSLRSLLAAVVSARVQSRRAIIDIQDYTPCTPTLFAVVGSVTLNRPQRDTELTVGVYAADFRDGERTVEYHGLGDDPSRYRVTHHHRRLRIEDDQVRHARAARDHRHEVFEQWQQRKAREKVRDERLKKIAAQVAAKAHHDASVARETLKTLLWLLADLSPVPASILLFAKGAAGIHHLYRVHRLARGAEDPHAARAIIHEVSSRVDRMAPDQAQAVIESIFEGYHVDGAA